MASAGLVENSTLVVLSRTLAEADPPGGSTRGDVWAETDVVMSGLG